MKTAISAIFTLLVCGAAMAELWPPLDGYVKMCDLIVVCETEMLDNKPIFKVVGEWKGEYKATSFNEHLQARVPQAGYLPAELGLHSGRKPYAGQKVVFFFTPSREKYSGSSTSFDVRDGKLTYAETSEAGMSKEYTLEEFKAAILRIASSQNGAPGNLGFAEDRNVDATKVARLGVMTWYHPPLEPGLADMTLLTTVVSQSQTIKTPGSPYWNVRLRIDERIHVAPAFAKRLEGIELVDSGDYRERKIGDRVVVFAGLGEPYFGDDFLLPCWSGTTTDLGILLHEPDSLYVDDNERLLASLRTQAKVRRQDRDPLDLVDDLEIFAEFCPKGVAHSLIREKRRAEMRKMQEEDLPGSNAPKK